ncbi:MAG: adenylate/guanylate cyclase domain-containing protein [Elusimicrobia bacterium]|nr:adenylate/guanylate cyclase domain-containing protein [Elusimicrobiota bacterium]
MAIAVLNEEEKKKLKGFFAFAGLPYWLHVIGADFSKVCLSAFYGADEHFQGYKDVDAGGGVAILVMFSLVYFWMRPAILYKKKPSDALKEKIRRRLRNIYRSAGILLLAVTATRLVFVLSRGGAIPAGTLPALLLGALAQACIFPIAIDWTRSKNNLIMDMLYKKEELYRLRPEFSIPLYLKIVLLIFSCAILPFGMIFLAFQFGAPVSAWHTELTGLLAMCTITLLAGLGAVFYGIQLPLDGLIDKMRRVSDGNFDVKTRVYFSDEVARLKAGFNEMVDGLKERAELQDTFGKYLSIEIARELIKNKKVNLGGEDIEAAVMFCDIRNFTPLSEPLSATAVVEFLNNYFRYITPPITAHNGVISKFMGDAVMAVFTPQLGSKDYAADAVRAAAGMRAALAEFNAAGKAPEPVNFGIGVHSGRLVAGNIGTFSRLEYTFIGDTVNTASRLQSKTKDFGTDIIVSAAALEKAREALGGQLAFEPLGRTVLKGRTEQVEIYKVL